MGQASPESFPTRVGKKPKKIFVKKNKVRVAKVNFIRVADKKPQLCRH